MRAFADSLSTLRALASSLTGKRMEMLKESIASIKGRAVVLNELSEEDNMAEGRKVELQS